MNRTPRRKDQIAVKRTMSPFALAALLTLAASSFAADPVYSTRITNPFGLSTLDTRPRTEFVDIDADGDLDYFLGSTGPGEILFRRNTGNPALPAFASATPSGLVVSGSNLAPCFGDLNGDGDQDAIVTDAEGHFYFFQNLGTPTSPFWDASELNPYGMVTFPSSPNPRLKDIDADGDLDLFVAKTGTGIYFAANTGNSTAPIFEPFILNPFGITTAGLENPVDFGDLDGDGDLDLLQCASTGSIQFQRNTGNASTPAFAAPQTDPFGLIGTSFGAITLADTDSDGDLDVFVGNSGGGTSFQENFEIIDFSAPTLNFVRLDPVTTSENVVRYQLNFSEPVTPSFSLQKLAVNGPLAPVSTLLMPDTSQHSTFVVYVVLHDFNATGNLGIRVNGPVTDAVGNPLNTPSNSPLYTFITLVPGDVNKDGAFNIADVALLADANLSLAVLP